MRFGTYHTFQCPPWTTPDRVLREELERVELAEALGYDSVWVPEQHFFDYCACPDALAMVMHVLGRTERVRVGAAVANLNLTHPLRFAERVALLDHLGGGRVDICVGRGYQWPQNVVLQVDEAATRDRFEEALDVVLQAWTGEPAGYRGRFFEFPPVRIWPAPRRPPGEVLLHAVGGTTPFEQTVARGMPMALSQPFAPVEQTAANVARYVEVVEGAGAGFDADLMLDRSIVVLYALLAPTAEEARSLAKGPFEWHMATLAKLMTPPDPTDPAAGDGPGGTPPGWDALGRREVDPPEMPDAEYASRTETMLVFDDPDGCAAKIDLLRSAGARNVVVWMGVGGVAHEHVVRSMRLFAEEVAPRFA